MSVPLTLLGLLERGRQLPGGPRIYRLEADLRWIDHTAARLDLLAQAVR